MARVTYVLHQAVDGWMDQHQDVKVIHLCPMSGGKAYYWDSKVLEQGATALEQAPVILEGLQSLISAGVTVTAIVTDSEFINGALHHELKKFSPSSFILYMLLSRQRRRKWRKRTK